MLNCSNTSMHYGEIQVKISKEKKYEIIITTNIYQVKRLARGMLLSSFLVSRFKLLGLRSETKCL